MGVFVPGTGKIGLPIAASVGALGGNPDAGLEVLAGITTAQVKEALEMIEAGHVTIDRADSNEEVFCHAIATAGQDCAEVTVSGGHTDIVETRKNNKRLFELRRRRNQLEDDLRLRAQCSDARHPFHSSSSRHQYGISRRRSGA